MQAVDTDRFKVDDHCWIVECANCGTRFEATRSDASYCTPRCRKYASRAPQRFKSALEELAAMASRASEISHNYPHSQTMLDQMIALYKSIGHTLDNFDVEWEQVHLPTT